MELVILAAGMGSRFGGLKQIEPVDNYGNFIIDYSIYDAIEAGFDSVVFIIKEELYDDFRETIGKRIEGKIKVKYAFQKKDYPYEVGVEREKPMGTGHAILCAKDVIEGPFAIINADDYYGKDAYKVAYDYLSSLDNKKDAGKYANVAYKAVNTLTECGSVKRGVCYQDENHFLTKMVESSVEIKDGIIYSAALSNPEEVITLSFDQEVSMNMFLFTTEFINYLDKYYQDFLKNTPNLLKDEYLLPDVVSKSIKFDNTSVKILSTTAKWYGVTYKADKDPLVASLKALVDKGLYKVGLWD